MPFEIFYELLSSVLMVGVGVGGGTQVHTLVVQSNLSRSGKRSVVVILRNFQPNSCAY